MRVVALIPAYNEADYIEQTITAVASLHYVDEIMVINDGSKDDTAALVQKQKEALSKKVTLINLRANRGKGAALNSGLRSASGDVYLLLDADLGDTASLAQGLLEPVLHDQADMSIARFGVQQSASGVKMGMGLVRRTACRGVRLLTGRIISSPLSGQRAIKALVLQTLGDFFEGFGVEVGLTVGALHHGFRIVEIPLEMKHRAYGRGFGGFWHRGRQWVQVVRALWRCWRRGWHL